MGFRVADISFTTKWTRVYFDNHVIAKEPWTVHTVPCPKHKHDLNTNVWTFSEYEDWGDSGKSAKLTLGQLNPDDLNDQDLKNLFDQGDIQVKMKVQFKDITRVYVLPLSLKP